MAMCIHIHGQHKVILASSISLFFESTDGDPEQLHSTVALKVAHVPVQSLQHDL